MEKLQFKTNINCGGCIAKVAPFMNGRKDLISSWQVDTASPLRLLTVETDADAKEIEEVVLQAGFKAEQLL